MNIILRNHAPILHAVVMGQIAEHMLHAESHSLLVLQHKAATPSKAMANVMDPQAERLNVCDAASWDGDDQNPRLGDKQPAASGGQAGGPPESGGDLWRDPARAGGCAGPRAAVSAHPGLPEWLRGTQCHGGEDPPPDVPAAHHTCTMRQMHLMPRDSSHQKRLSHI